MVESWGRGREGGREGGKEGGREGGKKGGRKGRKGGREGGREGRIVGESKRWKEKMKLKKVKNMQKPSVVAGL